ncbi:omptin family outer membrane protease [Gracilinema caldarium]|uniref:Uncharacterized protein n=1 Tax=Gracilinema caldarium (strain ATCC 51460 / DSM 7334 / H1) TaxID=744872 RepID=F8F1L0_GRAC1|nr:omptin family outer membrane protease [Gracilinema caldarium]AEJ19063.1 hypothetical protein Spica_0913 [Gracilinema caldarium DSM 7334]
MRSLFNVKYANLLLLVGVWNTIGPIASCFPLGGMGQFSFSSETNTGVSWGRVEELVFQGEKQISRLLWDTNWVPHLGVKGTVRYRWFTGTLEAATAFPVRSGALEDFDYLLSDASKPSHYSWHEAYLDKDMFFGTSWGIRFPLVTGIAVESQLGFAYQNRKWTGQNGYLQYPVSGYWTGAESKQILAGPVISYEQSLWYPRLVLAVNWGLSGTTGLSVGGSWIPYLHIQALDNHFLRDPPMQFYDQLQDGSGYKGAVKLVVNSEGTARGEKTCYMGLKVRSFYVKGSTASRTIGSPDVNFVMDPVYSAGSRELIWQFSVGIRM